MPVARESFVLVRGEPGNYQCHPRRPALERHYCGVHHARVERAAEVPQVIGCPGTLTTRASFAPSATSDAQLMPWWRSRATP
jgi:hypothetical protein